MDDRERYERARERVAQLRGFYVHAMVFVLVNAGLAAYNLLITPNTLWFVFSLVGWGIGLAAHGVYIFGVGRLFGREWEERKIREELERQSRRDR